ncbi:MAG: DUF1570 domain-containing protein [Candidatus Brocadiae bacterium]|nr:DUF1570 domain-containing protein [Candidatus Brocadiia bacterium]
MPRARPAPSAAARLGASAEAPAKKSPVKLIAAVVLGLAVLGGGGFFAWRSMQGTGGGGASSPEATYEKKLAALKAGKTDDLSIALWCSAQKPDRYDAHLDEAARKSPGDSRVMSALAERYWTRLAARPPASAAECLALIKEAEAAGLITEKKRLARIATTFDDANEEAWAAAGAVKFTPSGEDSTSRFVAKVEHDRLAEDDRKQKEEAARLAGLSERDKRVMDRVTRLRIEFGADFIFKEDKPLLFCIQTSPGYNAELKLDEYVGELKAFYSRFYERFGDKFQLGDLNDQVMLIWIFRDPQTYRIYGDKRGLPAGAGGHWEGSAGAERLMLFHSSDNRADPYGTIFHETVHMIVYYATQLRGKSSGQMLWFTEGIATYFEPFTRDERGRIRQDGNTLNKDRLPMIRNYCSQNAHVKLTDMLAKTYRDFSFEMAAPGDPRRKLERGLLYYAQAWSMVYFFYNYENGKYAEKFEQYFREELNGNPGPATFRKVFGENLDTLEKEWLEFTKSLR